MGKQHKVAWVQVTLKLDTDTDEYSVEVHEWARGRTSELTAFLDIPDRGASAAELAGLCDYTESAVRHLVTEYIELDKGRIF
jgi:hypothetical protein